MSFSYKPDAIKGRYKRTPAAKAEKARIIAYLWSGTFKSSIPSGKSTRMQDDVDRAIMGRVSGVAGDGKLVASCDYGFETTKNNDWEEIVVPINYKLTDVVPTKMNVIIQVTIIGIALIWLKTANLKSTMCSSFTTTP